MSSGLLKIDLSENSTDPCKEYLIQMVKCSKGKTREERREQCFQYCSSYLDCRLDPKTYQVKGKK